MLATPAKVVIEHLKYDEAAQDTTIGERSQCALTLRQPNKQASVSSKGNRSGRAAARKGPPMQRKKRLTRQQRLERNAGNSKPKVTLPKRRHVRSSASLCPQVVL